MQDSDTFEPSPGYTTGAVRFFSIAATRSHVNLGGREMALSTLPHVADSFILFILPGFVYATHDDDDYGDLARGFGQLQERCDDQLPEPAISFDQPEAVFQFESASQTDPGSVEPNLFTR